MASFLEKSCKDDDDDGEGGDVAQSMGLRGGAGHGRGGGWRTERVAEPAEGQYLTATFTCPACRKQVPVFCWRGWPGEPPNPVPGSIERGDRRSSVRDCWFNICSYCMRHLSWSPLRGLAWRPRTEEPEVRVLLPGDVLLDGAVWTAPEAGGGR